ncbi:MAG: universal stress protein [Pseudomonadales bacterium]
MRSLKNILVVLGDDRDDAGYVLEKAALLASGSGAAVHAVRVVYEGIADLSATAIDSAAQLKTFILEAEETVTEELVEPARRRLPALETATLWNPRHWEGVLHAAQQTEADLIVKGASRHSRFGDIVRTPDDWNLLRCAAVPVMLVKPQVWVKDPVIVCALDAFDPAHDALNEALLREAEALTQVLGGSLHLVVAYPLFERWVGELGSLRDYDDLKQEIEKEIRARVVALTGKLGVSYARLYADEGRPDTVIGVLAGELDAELVVVGTHARQGLRGVLMGNTSERLVYELATDVVTVHADDAS